jgi:hypothetical protein
MIPKVVAIETTVVETGSTEPVVEAVTTTAPGPGTMGAPEPSAEARIDPHPKVSADVVVREEVIEEAAPLRLAPMPETGSSSCEFLELLDDDLIDPAFVSLSMESWCRMENWIKVYCEYLKFTCLLNIEH